MDIKQMMKEGQRVHVVTQDLKDQPDHFLLTSDIHFDSRTCNRDLLKKHLEEAKKKNAKVIINGDLFDIMGSRHDPRRSHEGIRDEYDDMIRHENKSYLDAVFEDCFRFFLPYKDNLLLIGFGNHESSIMKNNGTSMTERIVGALNIAGSRVQSGFYEGYLILQYKKGKRSKCFVIKYHHGYQGGPRSKGSLQDQINAMKWPDADLIMTGHNHFKDLNFENMETFNSTYTQMILKKQYHLKTGSYQLKPTGKGWAVEKGFSHLPQGGWWMEIDHSVVGNGNHVNDGKSGIVLKPKIYEAD